MTKQRNNFSRGNIGIGVKIVDSTIFVALNFSSHVLNAMGKLLNPYVLGFIRFMKEKNKSTWFIEFSVNNVKHLE